MPKKLLKTQRYFFILLYIFFFILVFKKICVLGYGRDYPTGRDPLQGPGVQQGGGGRHPPPGAATGDHRVQGWKHFSRGRYIEHFLCMF